jgi:outer membrane protein assembly factor BamA
MKNLINLKALLPLCIVLLINFSEITAQTDSAKTENIKKGLTFGALPTITYNTDLGFQYGALVNFYLFGDGSTYPKYLHSLYAEVSRFTKGSGINRLFYDSEFLIPGIRLTSDLSYLTEKALDFYGFNGYDAIYNPIWEDQSVSPDASRLFYKHQRQMFRFITTLQGPLKGDNIRWVAGFGILNNSIDKLDIDALNKGKDEADRLPDVPGLYDKYVDWGIIGENEKMGGWANHLKFGLVYDTRDFDPNPMKGIWSEAVILTAPKFLGNGDFGFTKLSLTHRQYFTLIEKNLSFAYRLNYQGTINGKVPFYMQPYMVNSFSLSASTDGLGGSQTVRGLLRNRLVGDGVAFGNAELRWKFYRTVLWKQNIYLAINTFYDAGQVVKKIELDLSNVPDFEKTAHFDVGAEGLHSTVGAGLRIVMNENFIVAADFGKPLDERDGKGGLYIGLNYLF